MAFCQKYAAVVNHSPFLHLFLTMPVCAVASLVSTYAKSRQGKALPFLYSFCVLCSLPCWSGPLPLFLCIFKIRENQIESKLSPTLAKQPNHNKPNLAHRPKRQYNRGDAF